MNWRQPLEDLWPVIYHQPLNVNPQIIRPLMHELELAGYTDGED